MGKATRAKGLAGEREVAKIWDRAGFTVRSLEGQGDHLIIPNVAPDAHGRGHLALHMEVKRQERIRLLEWLRQAELEAPQGTIPVVAFRPSRSVWYAGLPLENLVELCL